MTRQLSRPSPYLDTLLAITPDMLRAATAAAVDLGRAMEAGVRALGGLSTALLEDAMIRHGLSVAELALVGDLLRTTPATLEEACRQIVQLRATPAPSAVVVEVYPETVRAIAAAARGEH